MHDKNIKDLVLFGWALEWENRKTFSLIQE